MDLHLEGKVVILTGGFKGIGKGIALRLAKEGAIVAVINRDDGAAEQFDAEMKAITDNYRTYLMDLNDTDDIAPIVEDVVKTYGHIDGLVNNAGRNDNLDLDHTSWREFEQSLHGNFTHYYELAHRCAPYLRESKGAIVDISSKTALTGQGKTSAYAANLLVFDASKGPLPRRGLQGHRLLHEQRVLQHLHHADAAGTGDDALAKAASPRTTITSRAGRVRLRTPSLRTSVVWKSTRSSSASPAAPTPRPASSPAWRRSKGQPRQGIHLLQAAREPRLRQGRRAVGADDERDPGANGLPCSRTRLVAVVK